jgi:hypothetical protein
MASAAADGDSESQIAQRQVNRDIEFEDLLIVKAFIPTPEP